ncbi:hypothetical protein [Sediminitomix flava]|uniref:Uncharacterized protein n=1 Tax=Sediminitomix flava TaxID=379075 RepID=A0A315ZBE1_SEDFL|nr:hypothetical protein [Sediminitomix flava]PWJ42680.1 hypothetical protein BC781_102225 [Sediminitomix flava]
MNTFDFSPVFGASNYSDYATNETEAQVFIDEIFDLQQAVESESQKDEIDQRNDVQSRPDVEANIQSLEEDITYLDGKIPTLPDGKIKDDHILDRDRKSVQLRTTQNSYERRYKFLFVKRAMEIELNNALSAEYLELLNNFFSYCDTQSWTINDYGLRSN